ncbi:unnamed protein product [Paramecium pentaurelia]|uniref:Uncharacterized protein n=1 Tax=Paramecium pentaurelia TaxID=43138 RepID=A0A8S1Y861_9CILI|nr:unnamed protein product [Paramecium pentaurelia]
MITNLFRAMRDKKAQYQTKINNKYLKKLKYPNIFKLFNFIKLQKLFFNTNYQYLLNLQGELLEGQRYRHALLKFLQLIILDRYPQLIYIVMRNMLFTEIQSQKLLFLLTKQNLQLKLIDVGESKFVKNKSMSKDVGTFRFILIASLLCCSRSIEPLI